MANIRLLEIDICPNDDWVIIDRKLHNFAEENRAGFFANCYVKDGQITYIFDIGFHDLDKAKQSNLFSEICEFLHKDHKFSGTFIDALEYIRANFGSHTQIYTEFSSLSQKR